MPEEGVEPIRLLVATSSPTPVAPNRRKGRKSQNRKGGLVVEAGKKGRREIPLHRPQHPLDYLNSTTLTTSAPQQRQHHPQHPKARSYSLQEANTTSFSLWTQRATTSTTARNIMEKVPRQQPLLTATKRANRPRPDFMEARGPIRARPRLLLLIRVVKLEEERKRERR